MARMRSIKPEFWQDQELTRLPRDTRLMYIGMWNLADEHARLQGDARFIKGQLFPYDDDLTPKKIDGMVDELVEAGKVERYTVRGAVYLLLLKMAKHQRLEPEKVSSRLPGPDESEQVSDPDMNESAPRADESELDADKSALSMLHVAGSMKQGASPREIQIRFDEFWNLYRRKEAKADALKKFTAAIKAGTTADVIIAGLVRFNAATKDTEQKFIPHPSTWLNQGRWADELPTASQQRPVNQGW